MTKQPVHPLLEERRSNRLLSFLKSSLGLVVAGISLLATLIGIGAGIFKAMDWYVSLSPDQEIIAMQKLDAISGFLERKKFELLHDYDGLGQFYLTKHEYQLAKESFSRALIRSPSDHRALVGRSRAALELRDNQNARTDLEAALRIQRSWDALTRMGDVQFNEKQYDGAVANYKESLALNPRSIDTRIGMVRAQARLKQVNAIVELLKLRQEALDSHTVDFEMSEIAAALAAEYRRASNFDLAIRYVSEAIKHSVKSDAELYSLRGQFYYTIKDFNAARKDFDVAWALKPYNSLFIYDRANTYYATGQFEKALLDMREAARLDDKMTRAWEGVGLCLIALKRYEEALTAFDVAAKLEGDAHNLFVRGWIRNELRQYSMAVNDLDQAIKLNARDARFFLARAQSKLGLNRRREGEADILEAKRIDSNVYPGDIFRRSTE